MFRRPRSRSFEPGIVRHLSAVGSALTVCVSLSTSAWAGEGQWPVQQVGRLDAKLAESGFELQASDLWRPGGDEQNGGLMRAVIKLGGCSAAFVSPEGLIATNHHCAFSALQAQSAASQGAHDYLRDGFVARERSEEIEAPNLTAQLLRAVSDVSEAVHAKARTVSDPAARAEAIRQAQRDLVAECEAAGPDRSCRVAAFDHGARYELHEWVEYDDLRLVYAPPRAIGEFGGEVDNWMWPRHSGDFTLLRLYAPEGADAAAGSQPYRPGQWLRPSAAGVREGDFVAVMGYPGSTSRYLWTSELERHIQQVLPQRVDAYGRWIRRFEELGARDPSIAIKVAALLKSLANKHKNAVGKLAGLEHMQLLDRRRAEDAQIARAWSDAASASSGGGESPLVGLTQLSAQREARYEREFLLLNLKRISSGLASAIDLVRLAREQSRPDDQRAEGYMDRDIDRLERTLEKRLRNFDPRVELTMLTDWVMRWLVLPVDQRPAGLARLTRKLGASPDGTKVRAVLERWLTASSIHDAKTVRAAFADPNPRRVRASKDPLLVWARALAPAYEVLEAEKLRDKGVLSELGPAYFVAVRRARGGDYYPDANSTLRISVAKVRGYDKWDGATQTPQTTLAGAISKHHHHAGAAPFNLPAAVIEAAAQLPHRFMADNLAQVPLCFLADADTTGGNSGSPVIDAKGRFVGLNFDRVWENVAGDYGYADHQSRNVSVDARYLYWMLDEVVGAETILAELGVADVQLRSQAPEQAVGGGRQVDEAAAQPEPPPIAPKTPCGCVFVGADAGQGWGLLGLICVLLGWRKTRR